MFVAGIDAHSTYLVVTIVNNIGELVHKGREPLAARYARACHRQASRQRPGQPSLATLHGGQETSRLARRTQRRSATPRPGHPRHATHR
jgi:hypothetical protein